MSAETWSIVLTVIVVGVTILGNILIGLCRSQGWNTAADWIARMTPIAVAAASSKTREQAIKVIVDEVFVQGALVSQRIARAVNVVVSEGKPPTAATPPKDPPNGAGPTIPSGPPDEMDVRDDELSSVRRAPVLLACIGMFYLSGCTPQQLQAAKDISGVAAKIGKEVCAIVDGQSDEEWVAFACRVVEKGADVLSNMSTEEYLDASRSTGGVEIKMVRAEDAAAFAEAHK